MTEILITNANIAKHFHKSICFYIEFKQFLGTIKL